MAAEPLPQLDEGTEWPPESEWRVGMFTIDDVEVDWYAAGFRGNMPYERVIALIDSDKLMGPPGAFEGLNPAAQRRLEMEYRESFVYLLVRFVSDAREPITFKRLALRNTLREGGTALVHLLVLIDALKLGIDTPARIEYGEYTPKPIGELIGDQIESGPATIEPPISTGKLPIQVEELTDERKDVLSAIFFSGGGTKSARKRGAAAAAAARHNVSHPLYASARALLIQTRGDVSAAVRALV